MIPLMLLTPKRHRAKVWGNVASDLVKRVQELKHLNESAH